ncbi:unnamed protein product [Nezara viridula]|uniref:Methyltransferase type 11 domain-containing protein n=1 Tax=Nezara viridula TaxID=85310 RepID=A0A9P0E966_NEZVI|nr:unnamed protein product [Nezara viridula]
MEDPQLMMNWNYMQKKDVIEILEEYKHHMDWKDGEQILDIGCGIGDITTSVLYPILPMNSVLAAADVSPDMIQFCNKYKMRERIRYYILDIQQPQLSTDWESETFDKIFSFSCLHWIHDYSQAMANIHYLLKHTGEILLLFLTPDNPIYLAFHHLLMIPKWKRFLKNVTWFYQTDDALTFVENILRRVGFQGIRCFPKIKRSDYHSWESFMELVRAINPYTRHLPDEIQAEFLYEASEVLKQTLHIMVDQDTGAVMMEYNVIIAMAFK